MYHFQEKNKILPETLYIDFNNKLKKCKKYYRSNVVIEIYYYYSFLLHTKSYTSVDLLS